MFSNKPSVGEPVARVEPDQVNLGDDTQEREQSIDAYKNLCFVAMVGKEPAAVDKRSWNFKEYESYSDSNDEVLLPESNIEVREGEEMVDKGHPFQIILDSHQENHDDRLNEEVARCEHDSPDVAVPWH